MISQAFLALFFADSLHQVLKRIGNLWIAEITGFELTILYQILIFANFNFSRKGISRALE